MRNALEQCNELNKCQKTVNAIVYDVSFTPLFLYFLSYSFLTLSFSKRTLFLCKQGIGVSDRFGSIMSSVIFTLSFLNMNRLHLVALIDAAVRLSVHLIDSLHSGNSN